MNIKLYTNDNARENVLKSYRGFSLKFANDIINEVEGLSDQERADRDISKILRVEE